MKWDQDDIGMLAPILDRVQADLEPLEGKNLLVLCSAGGEVAFHLAERIGAGKVTGLELDPDLLASARLSARRRGLEDCVEFQPTEKKRLPLPDGTFDGLVSEFIVFPTTTPTEIGQPEMARVLKPGGRMVVTDVIVTRPLPQLIRQELRLIGLDYLCEGSIDDFRNWMAAARLTTIEAVDFTPVVEKVWQQKREKDPSPEHRRGYDYLLDDPHSRLGRAIFYIYIRGEKL